MIAIHPPTRSDDLKSRLATVQEIGAQTLFQVQTKSRETKTTYSQGNMYNKPYGTFSIVLVDMANSNTIWIDEVQTKGSAFTNHAGIAKKAFKKAARSVLKAGLF